MDLVVRGARQHNLKSIDVTIPRDKLVVITGPSGSGKSSLAFDTIYAEGQRRYVESLSAYARQFLDNMPKPDVDTIDGLSPAISIEQQTTSRNPRSTVGTVTEIYDYLRLLFARAGTPHCPNCGDPIAAQTVQQMVDQILAQPSGTRFIVQAPLVRARKGEFKRELLNLRKEGFVRATVDGEVRDLGDDIVLEKTKTHSIDVHIDRLAVKPEIRQRLTESVELALKLADGLVRIELPSGEPWLLSERFACAKCGISLPEIEPRMFSFNNPAGACEKCNGLGENHYFAPELVVPDPSLSLDDGAIAPWRTGGGAYLNFMLHGLVASINVKTNVPFQKLPKKTQDRILFGDRESEGGYEGVIPGIERRSREYEKRRREAGGSEAQTFEFIEEVFRKFARTEPCTSCHGARLRKEALAVRLSGSNIQEVTSLSIRDAQQFFSKLKLGVREAAVAERVIKEVASRLSFLVNVGLDYLSLDRSAATLSGGEAERIRLATQIGAGLVGVLYVLDEPSIGLHPRDNDRLIGTLRALRDLGNTVIVVEHDSETILAADHVIDMGPRAGKHGGYVTAIGSPQQIQKNKDSLTGLYLSGKRGIEVPKKRRTPREDGVRVSSASSHNLKNVDVTFPLGVFTCVTGVSGSGKSSLVIDTLLEAARGEVNGARVEMPTAKVEGFQSIDKVISIDQAAIGRSPRSNPATYTGVFGVIRDLYAGLPEARARGYKPGRFSFNVKGGRCEACEGDGVLRIEMHFLPDVFVQCEVCRGKRYNRETLEILYKGKSIADMLAMPIDEALDLLQAVPKVRAILSALSRVGLGYVELGQSATTLSGGEAQRVKLAKELARTATGNTLYVLDEPTTGLHFTDIEILIGVLQALVDAGNSVIVIEHNLDVIKCADYVVDMGPEGGSGGGLVVAQGTPEAVARVKGSHTAKYLARALAS